MKEQIKKLMRQACKESFRPESVLEDVPQDVLEKFAQLIVANFIDQITIVKSNDEVVAVTLTDEEHQIQKVIWEKQIVVDK
jgi:hypothetical protein